MGLNIQLHSANQVRECDLDRSCSTSSPQLPIPTMEKAARHDETPGLQDRETDSRPQRPRRVWGQLLLVVAAMACFMWPHYHRGVSSGGDRVQRILAHTPLIGQYCLQICIGRELTVLLDGHDDFPIVIRVFYKNHIEGSNFTEPFTHGKFPMHVDLPRLKKGLVGGTFWSVFVPCPANWTDFSDANYAASMSPSRPRPLVYAG